MTFQAWQHMARNIELRRAALDRQYWHRANVCAGRLGSQRNVWHNAMLARESGRPWAEVDYRSLREAIYLDRKRDALSQLCARIVDRAWRAVDR